MVLENYEPKEVLRYFEEISAIPRGSGNEAAVSAYVEKFAKDRGLFVVRDSANNVFIRKEATAGRENDSAVCMQGHLDMVCEANAGVKHDFLKDGIELRVDADNDTLRANGTTLGADDGVADAIMLAILDSDSISHPAIECIFTTDEETGMSGMRAFDTSLVKSRMMVNLDSSGEGEATVSCAGGVRCNVTFPVRHVSETPSARSAVKIAVSGLYGGHSGEDINLGRTNAVKAMARILVSLSKYTKLSLISIEGGSKDNAIPRECTAVAAVDNCDAAMTIIEKEAEAIRHSLCKADEGFTVSASKIVSSEPVISDSAKLINLLNILPSGVHSMCNDIPGMVETSSNLGIVKTTAGSVDIVVSCRSSVETELDYMQQLVESCSMLSGCTAEHKSRYPGWAFVSGSKLQGVYLESYKALFGADAKIIGIHAGLECGLFVKRVPDMDIISIGPDVRNLHSPDETLSISSLDRLYRLVIDILGRVR